MKAIRIHAYGGPDVMRLEELPTPVPGPGEALVRIHAASVNFLDVQKRRGELVGQAFYNRQSSTRRPQAPPGVQANGGEFPAFLGSQGVGVVEALQRDLFLAGQGFDGEQVKEWLSDAGLVSPRYRALPADPEAKGPTLFVASARKPDPSS